MHAPEGGIPIRSAAALVRRGAVIAPALLLAMPLLLGTALLLYGGLDAAIAQQQPPSQPSPQQPGAAAGDSPQQVPPPAGDAGAKPLCGELDGLAARSKQLFGEGKYAEALPVLDELAERTKGKEMCDQVYHLLALSNLNYLYDKANERLRELIKNQQYADAILLYEPLLDSFKNQLGTNSKSYTAASEDLKLLYQAHERQFDALYQKIVVLSREEHFEEALARAKEITEIGRAFERRAPDRYGDALTLLAESYRSLGRFTEAAPPFKQAVELIARAFGSDNPVIANRRDRLGRIYDAMGLPNEAEEQYKLALTIRERRVNADNRRALQEDVAESLHGLGFFYLRQGRLREAEPLLRRAVESLEVQADEIGKVKGLDQALKEVGAINSIKDNLADALNNLGLALRGLGKFKDAEDAYRRSFKIDQEIYGDSHPELAIILNNLALLYEAQSQYGKAETEIARATEMMIKAYGAKHPALAPYYHSMGMLELMQGRYASAEAVLRGSLILRKRSLGEDDATLALGYSSLGWALFDQGRWAEAYENFDDGTKILTRRAMRDARTTYASADVNAQSDIDQARTSFTGDLISAYELAAAQPDRHKELLEASFRIAQWAHTSSAGVALSRMAARYAGSDDALPQIVRERQDLVTNWRLIDQAVTVASVQGNTAQATELLARLDGINGRIAAIDGTLKSKFEKYAQLANPEPLTIDQVRDQLHDNEAFVLFFDAPRMPLAPERTLVWVVTKAAPPRWYSVPLGTPALTERVAALRCGLDVMAWRSTKDDPTRPLRCASALGAAAAPAWNAAGDLTKLPGFDLARAHDLYAALLSPVEDLIKDKHLLIVPSGPLTVLPFQVLVTAAPATAIPADAAAYAKVPWLGLRNAITVLPSAASLQALRQDAKPSQATLPFIGFGDPLLAGDDGTDRRAWARQSCANPAGDTVASLATGASIRTAAELFRGGLANVDAVRREPPLPETADELCAVARATGAALDAVNLGARATDTRVRELSADGTLGNARIVEFATHGLVTDEVEALAGSGAEPALILTPPEVATDKDDGLLRASEVATLKLDADWVILSACNTAAGSSKLAAEPLSGLARAFFYAGARSLLVSHWAVNSKATVKLIMATLNVLAADPAVGKAEALRRSMRQLITDGGAYDAHPAIWAPFVVVGEGSGKRP